MRGKKKYHAHTSSYDKIRTPAEILPPIEKSSASNYPSSSSSGRGTSTARSQNPRKSNLRRDNQNRSFSSKIAPKRKSFTTLNSQLNASGNTDAILQNLHIENDYDIKLARKLAGKNYNTEKKLNKIGANLTNKLRSVLTRRNTYNPHDMQKEKAEIDRKLMKYRIKFLIVQKNYFDEYDKSRRKNDTIEKTKNKVNVLSKKIKCRTRAFQYFQILISTIIAVLALIQGISLKVNQLAIVTNSTNINEELQKNNNIHFATG